MENESSFIIYTQENGEDTVLRKLHHDRLILANEDWLGKNLADQATVVGSIVIIEKPLSVRSTLLKFFGDPQRIDSYEISDQDFLIQLNLTFSLGYLGKEPLAHLGVRECVLLERSGDQVTAYALLLK